MPELPEVETIRRSLQPLIGCHFVGVCLEWPGLVQVPTATAFIQSLPGKTVQHIARHGKYLMLRLAPEGVLVAHLKMTGALLLQAPGAAAIPYTRAVLSLDPPVELRFCDRRKLGRLWLVPNEAEVTGKLGIDCLDPAFTPELLARLLSRHSAPIKAVLTDQGVLAGLGNMYADETLFLARVHPLTPAREQARRAKRLYGAIQDVLAEAIGNRGTTFSDYVNANGEKGTHQHHLRVAHRGGLPCPACGNPIKRLVLRNRGTYYCPRCQRAGSAKRTGP